MLSTDCKKKRNKSRLKTVIKAGTSLLLTAMFSFIALSGSSPSFKKAEAETESDSSKKIYLSYLEDKNDDIAVPLYALNDGASDIKIGLEQPENNKFLRLANFNGLNSEYAAVSVNVGLFTSSSASISLKYRFSEGYKDFNTDEAIFSVRFKNAEKTFAKSELTANNLFSYEWQSLSFNIDTDEVSGGKIYLTFNHGKNAYYDKTRTCFDIDDLSVISGGKNYINSGSFCSLDVSETDTLDTDVSSLKRDENKALMLGKNERAFSVNTEYSDTVKTDFDVGTNAVKLPKGAGSGLYTDSASGSQFVVYNKAENNSFIRMGKFDSAKDSPSVYMPFYNNESGVKENMPLTNRVYINFKYRLYLPDEAKEALTGNEVMLEFSTRRASQNNSGKITLDAMTINERDDGTWRTASLVLETNRSSTDYMIIIFYPHTAASFTANTYLDIDSLYVSYAAGKQNYAYDLGEFESMTKKSESFTSPLLPAISGNGIIYAENNVNSSVKIKNDSYISVNTGFTGTTGTFDVTAKIKAAAGDKLNVYFGGKNGVKFALTAGSDEETDDLTAVWTKEADGYTFDMTAVTDFSNGLNKVVFENNSDNDIFLDNLFIGQVKTVGKVAGDKAAFDKKIAEVKNKDLLLYTDGSKAKVQKALLKAEKITKFHSQKAMDEVLSAITAALSEATVKTDLTELKKTISAATAIIEDGKSYKKAGYMIFTEKYFAAKRVTENDSAETAENADKELKAAIKNLEEANYSAAAAAVAGAALCLAAIKRKAL